MIFNGSWMISDFSDTTKAPEGFDKKVGSAIFPEEGAYVSYQIGYMVCSKDKEHQDAAVKMVKFWTDAYAQQLYLEMQTNPPLSPNVVPSEEFKQKNPIYMELLDASKVIKYKYDYMDNLFQPNVVDAFQNLYPLLIYNKLTPEEMAKRLTELAGKNSN